MLKIAALTDSAPLIENPIALRERWKSDGYLFFREILDPALLAWAYQQYRVPLIAEGLIDSAVEAPIWTGAEPKTRRPCDAVGTTVWKEIIKQPILNDILRIVFDDEPVWQPIVAHRSGLPSGPLKSNHDIFEARHQDGPFNEGMQFAVCWIPLRDIALDSGSFAVAPGSHKMGCLHSGTKDFRIEGNAIPDDQWLSTDYHPGDVLMFDYMTAHAALPNLSNEIRTSIDIRAIPSKAPQPIRGCVERVEGDDVSILTDEGKHITVHVDDRTYIRDMNPRPRLSMSELQKIAYPGAHVLAMLDDDGRTTVLRRNFY